MKTVTYLISYTVAMKKSFTLKCNRYERGKSYAFITKTTVVDCSQLSPAGFLDCAIEDAYRRGLENDAWSDIKILSASEIGLTSEERAAKLIIPGVRKEITIDIEYDNLESLMERIYLFLNEVMYNWEKGSPTFLLPYGYREYEFTHTYAHNCFAEGRITVAEMVDLIFKPILSHEK